MKISLFQQNQYLMKLLTQYGVNPQDTSIFGDSDTDIQKFLMEVMGSEAYAATINSSDLVFEEGAFVSQENLEANSLNFAELLNDLLQNDDVKNTLDIDGSGVLSNEEIESFLNVMQGLDSDAENISMNDVLSAIQALEDGTFSLADETPIEVEDTEEIENIKDAQKADKSRKRGGGDDYSGDTTTQPTEPSLKSMSIEQLNSKKSEAESNLKEAQENVQAVYSGENEAVKTAQDDCDAKQLAYEEALKNDENISEELRTEQKENQTAINDKKDVINNLKSDISSKEGEITSQKSTIAADESQISAIQSSISNLNSQVTDDPDLKADIAAKKQAAQTRLESAKAKLEEDKATLERLEQEKEDLETNLSGEETNLIDLETERQAIETEILANCGEATKLALADFKAAETNVETVRTAELEKAKAAETQAQSALDEINTQIDVKQAQKTEKEFSVNSLDHPEQLYKAMGLEEQGLSFEVFSRAIEGYNNLEDKGNGFLGIFDTTQSNNQERYYLLDLNTFELVERSQMRTGSGNMDNIVSANKGGSHATLSGFERVSEEYYSSSMGKKAIRLDGLEEGINDNARAKGTVVHYTTANSTWGCKGFPPVRTNGKIDKEATYDRMRELFPTNTIVFTYPTDERYWEMSDYYA